MELVEIIIPTFHSRDDLYNEKLEHYTEMGFELYIFEPPKLMTL